MWSSEARTERLHCALTVTVSRLQRMDAGPRPFLTAVVDFLSKGVRSTGLPSTARRRATMGEDVGALAEDDVDVEMVDPGPQEEM